MRISEVRFTSAGPAKAATGLLGFVTCVLENLIRLDGLVLRRTSDGRLSLSYPARRDREGRDHPYMRPIDTPSRLALEREVLDQLALMRDEDL